VGEGIFVLTNDEVENLKLSKNEKELIKPLFKNSDIKNYYTNTENELNLINLRYTDRPNLEDYPNIKNHLVRFKKLLADRPQTGTLESAFNSGYWYVMSTSRRVDMEGAKIVAPQRSPQNTFGYNEIPWYTSADVYFITEKYKSVLLKYILALLNSKLTYLWLYNRGKRKGETLELYQKPLSEIPIKEVPLDDQRSFIEIVDKILCITNSVDYLTNSSKEAKVKEYESQIDQMVYKIYDLTNDEIEIVENFNNKK
jgi:adenine-specific DNA-methyltransferase